MRAVSKMFILKHPNFTEALDDKDLLRDLHAAGVTRAGMGHGRFIVECPIDNAEKVRGILDEDFFDVEARNIVTIDLPPPSGRRLMVNFEYEESGQVATAQVDERHWAVMTLSEDPARTDGEMENDAFAALYHDVEIHPHYVPGGGIAVQDVMTGVEFWNPHKMAYDEAFWDEDEPMAQITLTAQAEPAHGGEMIEVIIPETGTSTVTWEMPVRLLPAKDAQVGKDKVALLPCAPDAARKWAAVCPFEIEIEMPEPDFGMAP